MMTLCRIRRQAERWGAELFQEDVEFIDVQRNPFIVHSSERKVTFTFSIKCILIYLVKFIYDALVISFKMENS